MIVVSGQGRSGTSLVAQIYRELGFDPGGIWHPESTAGYEDEDVVRANGAVLADLQVSVYSDALTSRQIIRKIDHLSRFARATSWARGGAERVALRVLGEGAAPLTLMPWDRFDEIVASHGPRLVELASTRPVCKDPRFRWTLGFWLAAGAPIEHVLLCVRNTEAVVQSRNKAGHFAFRTPSAARNSVTYSLGLCLSWIYDYRLDHGIVRFPDFVHSPSDLYEAMRFPEPVPVDAFRDAWRRVSRADLVHDTR